jgi:putative transferase (TIGR04331 family)
VTKRFLVTTALEETWPVDQPVLFLGEWCRLHARKDSWSKLDAEVAPYHWDDRAKLFGDYEYLQDFHERLLEDLTIQLNQIHGTSHSVRYWRILIGPWLGYFTQMLFDRWESIRQVTRQYDLSGTIVLTGQEDRLVPNDMTDLLRLLCTDEWNHHLYANILQGYTSMLCIKRQRQDLEKAAEASSPRPSLARRVRRKLADWYCKAAAKLSRSTDALFLGTGLPFRDEMRLYCRFWQVPQWWRSAPLTEVALKASWRQWIVIGNCETEFESCIRALIPKQIPRAYLEGYAHLVELTENLPWPKAPKLVWTNNSFNADDVFKAWAAEKAEHGSAMVVSQHGGLYGVGRWLFNEEHEIAISDSYLSWGWSEREQPKVKPLGQLSAKFPLGVRHSAQAGALLVTSIVPRQSYWMFSFLVARQWLDYFDDQCTFVQNLPASIRGALTVRLHSLDYGWAAASRWKERFPDLRLDEGKSDINDLIRKSRLYIATYNATTYLESFNMDVPTVIYWNPKFWELRDSAAPYFDDLMRVGIFHKTPESAARHVAAIWGDVDAWWYSPSVREVLARFKLRYCHLPDDLLDEVEVALREVISASSHQQAVAGLGPSNFF